MPMGENKSNSDRDLQQVARLVETAAATSENISKDTTRLNAKKDWMSEEQTKRAEEANKSMEKFLIDKNESLKITAHIHIVNAILTSKEPGNQSTWPLAASKALGY